MSSNGKQRTMFEVRRRGRRKGEGISSSLPRAKAAFVSSPPFSEMLLHLMPQSDSRLIRHTIYIIKDI